LTQPLYTIRGREIGPKDLETIRGCIHENWTLGRTAISKALCRQWDWTQPNGWLKDRACRDLLLALERHGEIQLPARRNEGPGGKKRVQSQEFLFLDPTPLEGKVSDYGPLTLTMVRKSGEEPLWDFLIHRYHYLARPLLVGSYLKYLVHLDGHLVAAMGWASAALKVASRDTFIGWDPETRKRNLHRVVNNVRFLILPWVRIQHLASKILGANARVIQRDWQAFYNTPIQLLETFVDMARFPGTSYRAANWQYLGQTKGSAKRGNRYTYHGQAKAVFVYPLTRHFRERLHG
jgi:hypothetical protein